MKNGGSIKYVCVCGSKLPSRNSNFRRFALQSVLHWRALRWLKRQNTIGRLLHFVLGLFKNSDLSLLIDKKSLATNQRGVRNKSKTITTCVLFTFPVTSRQFIATNVSGFPILSGFFELLKASVTHGLCFLIRL